jgi:hypothetical protein
VKRLEARLIQANRQTHAAKQEANPAKSAKLASLSS